MKVTFLGAAETVTGSCFLVEGGGKKFLVDCGMFQGKEEKMNEQPFEFDVKSIDFMLLTHAHIDHSGRIPKLVKEGYGGPIYSTKATADLCSILLPDSGHIQEMEIEWQNRKRMRAGKEPVEPLYTAEDAQLSLENFQYMFYNDVFEVDGSISFRFRDAGHILGSSIIEIWLKENGETIKLVFSGDLGQKNQPILMDPTVIEDADFVFIESTYGNRLHEDIGDRVEKLNALISRTVDRGGNVVIPSFAVGRTQELLYHLNLLKEDKEHNFLKGVKVFIDSPLAISATKIFQDNPQCYDAETLQLLKSGDNPFEFDKLFFTQTAEDSMKINEEKEGSVIISASGMCDAGRIKHHLKHNLWRKEASIVFVGYQAEGTLGRIIKDGVEKVKIFGEEIRIQADIEDIQGFSGHADRDGLLEWLNGFKSKPKKIFVVHGEQDSARDFAALIREKIGIEAAVAKLGQTVEIGPNTAAVAVGETKPYMGLTGENKVTVRIMQAKVDFMEAMDELYDKISSGEITADEAGNILDGIKKAIS